MQRDVAELLHGLAHLLDVGRAAVAELQVRVDCLPSLFVQGAFKVLGDQFDQVDALNVPAALAGHEPSPE